MIKLNKEAANCLILVNKSLLLPSPLISYTVIIGIALKLHVKWSTAAVVWEYEEGANSLTNLFSFIILFN